jgi:formylglycine-generating enzyme required for sulfatase activity
MRSRVISRLAVTVLLVAAATGCSHPPHGMVLIPAGDFIMGTDEVDINNTGLGYGIIKPWFEDEHPKRTLFLPAYYIDQYEVTNEQYQAYLVESNRKPPRYWVNNQYPAGKDHHPVSWVTWEEANGYCQWLGKTLPTEAQWEKAARGTDGRIYPWGNDFDPAKANIGGSTGGTKPVGSYEAGKSPYGIYDMIGNVWEWTADWYDPYPGAKLTADFYQNKLGKRYKVIRGLSWSPIGHYDAEDAKAVVEHYARASYRLFYYPTDGLEDLGFRCVKSA